jgi:hypothetical protein
MTTSKAMAMDRAVTMSLLRSSHNTKLLHSQHSFYRERARLLCADLAPWPVIVLTDEPSDFADLCLESNWIPTVADKSWFAYFRLYELTETYFDKSWPLGDFERIE